MRTGLTECGNGNTPFDSKLSGSQSQNFMQVASLGIQGNSQHQPQDMQGLQFTTSFDFMAQPSSIVQRRNKGRVKPFGKHLQIRLLHGNPPQD
jgi:hypothetical protein